MKDRIKKIRKSFPKEGKTQASFAFFLGISKQNLSSYEIGRRTPTDAVIQLICGKCNINEDWLRTGKGDMFKKIPNKLSFYLEQIAAGDDEFIQDLIEVYMELDPDSKKALKIFSEKMAEKYLGKE
ncbi:MAG: helix-turn-helix transcriptional regulator [Roseburia sp.]|nr:helix-turn-helix transcriptional regulator [Roseburia sp.]